MLAITVTVTYGSLRLCVFRCLILFLSPKNLFNSVTFFFCFFFPGTLQQPPPAVAVGQPNINESPADVVFSSDQLQGVPSSAHTPDLYPDRPPSESVSQSPGKSSQVIASTVVTEVRWQWMVQCISVNGVTLVSQWGISGPKQHISTQPWMPVLSCLDKQLKEEKEKREESGDSGDRSCGGSA